MLAHGTAHLALRLTTAATASFGHASGPKKRCCLITTVTQRKPLGWHAMRSRSWKVYPERPAPLRLRQKLGLLRGRGFDQRHTPPSLDHATSWPKWASLITMRRSVSVSGGCCSMSRVHSAMRETPRVLGRPKSAHLLYMGMSQA